MMKTCVSHGITKCRFARLNQLGPHSLTSLLNLLNAPCNKPIYTICEANIFGLEALRVTIETYGGLIPILL